MTLTLTCAETLGCLLESYIYAGFTIDIYSNGECIARGLRTVESTGLAVAAATKPIKVEVREGNTERQLIRTLRLMP